MLIKMEVLEAIRRGDISVQFRRWSRPSVRPGRTLKTRVGTLAIERMDEMRPEEVTLEDVRNAGFVDLADFRRWLDSMKPGPLFHRIQLRYVGPLEGDGK